MKFEDLLIVSPAKREVIIQPNKSKEELISQLIAFEKEFIQFVLDYIFKYQDTLLSKVEVDDINKLKNEKIINENLQLIFN
ncbi:hypothetical protein GW796_11310 [archaeon]|nr:hypothetical protein [archaeon]NCQ52441.1 hypothetical protein [archaeon]